MPRWKLHDKFKGLDDLTNRSDHTNINVAEAGGAARHLHFGTGSLTLSKNVRGHISGSLETKDGVASIAI